MKSNPEKTFSPQISRKKKFLHMFMVYLLKIMFSFTWPWNWDFALEDDLLSAK